MKRFWRQVGSVRLTVWLILALVAFCLLGTVIPQKGLLGKELYLNWQRQQPVLVHWLEWLKLTDLYRSPLAYTLWTLFFLNLLAGMTGRAEAIWRRCAAPEPPTTRPTAGAVRELPRIDLAELAGRLRLAGYEVRTGNSGLAAVKYRWTPLATLLFHLGFLVLLAGGIATVYSRFRAEADVAVGETFGGGYTRLLKKPLVGGVGQVSFTLADVQPRYFQRSVLTDLQVLIDDARGRHRCGINRPYRQGSLSFVVNRIDVAPLVTLLATDGRELDGATVKLKLLDGQPDSFELQGYTFRAELYPNRSASAKAQGGGVARTGSDRALPQPALGDPTAGGEGVERELVDPALGLEVRTLPGEMLAKGVLRPGQELAIGGVRLRLDGLTYWVHFYVGAERGLGMVYAAFALMVTALVLRFGLPRREIRAGVTGAGGWLEGRSEYYPTLFQDEIDRLLPEE